MSKKPSSPIPNLPSKQHEKQSGSGRSNNRPKPSSTPNQTPPQKKK